jgi:transcriptional repressor NrdR
VQQAVHYVRASGAVAADGPKKDGTREPFDRAKLHSGLTKACAKRRVAEEEIEFIVDEIEAELRDRRRHEVTRGASGTWLCCG